MQDQKKIKKENFRSRSREHKPKSSRQGTNMSVLDDRTLAPGQNDVHWYGSDEVLKLAGNLSFFKALGLPITDVYTRVAAPFGTQVRDTVPGIMFIHVMDSLPKSSTNAAIDAINVAARQQYALIRKANSGSKNYEWNDLIIYEIARSSLNEIYAFLCRAYGVANLYSIQNRYLPKALLAGMGFDADDFISNLASIRLYINNLARRINTLALPHSLSYFERKAWLYSSIYTDSASAKAQLYVITPSSLRDGSEACFLQYQPTMLSSGGCLTRESIFTNGGDFNNWKVEVDKFVDVLLSDDDCAIISGDILKAYGDTNLFKCNPIDENFTIEPVCNYEVLAQIENLVAAPSVPGPLSSDSGDDYWKHSGAIIQDGAGNLLFEPLFDTGSSANTIGNGYNFNPVLNYHKTDVTPSDVMVGTRLTCTFGVPTIATGGTGNYFVPILSCGTEIVTALVIARDPSYTYTNTLHSLLYTGSVASVVDLIDIANFDWAPKILVAFTQGGSSLYTLPFGDYETYRVIHNEELSKLHETATLSMFAVPLIDNYTR